ncbi:MAG TPA: hypothetical protein VKG82_03775 [Solirubrobacteraceae bacterium]|nr:hypothetical protein [Solirubrobacteraceae bacterium]
MRYVPVRALRYAARRPGVPAAGLLALALTVLAVSVALAAAAPGLRHALTAHGPRARAVVQQESGGSSPQVAVGLRVLRFVDDSRTIRPEGGKPEPRTLVTYVRYPAFGIPGSMDVLDAPATLAGGPYPLVVFGHGLAVTPQTYTRLLRSWAQAGFVVAAPLFPLASADSPGGPDEADVINQPTDMSFVISSMLALNQSGTGPLAGLINPAEIAVAGHSDGAETALAVAYSRRYHDPRVRAAVILSGAEMSGIGGYSFPQGSPPLLAVQGTADNFNEPRYTYAYFKQARRPKFLLRLQGAGHLAPYTSQQPQLSTVEQVTSAFLDGYLEQSPDTTGRLAALGDVARTSALVAEP